MNKAQLREALIARGFTIPEVKDWSLVSKVEDSIKYDVKFEKDGIFAVGQVKVTGNDTEEEGAVGLNAFAEPEVPFITKLDNFIRSKEVAPIHALVKKEVYDTDKAAVVDVYILTDKTVSKKTFLVRERANTFDYKEIV